MFAEFKEFAIKGNVVDMAVGIILGAAFSGVPGHGPQRHRVDSLVGDVLMPPLGAATGGLDFSEQFVVLRDGASPGPYLTIATAREAGATVLSYGLFLNSLMSFFMVALALFFVVRWMNRLRRPDTPAAPTTRACPHCKSSIDVTATRCAYCTSALGPAETPAAA